MAQRRTHQSSGSVQAQSAASAPRPAPVQPPSAQGPRIDSFLKSTLLLAFILLIVIPAVPFAMGPGLDASWAIGLNMGHFDKMVFGRDIIFTYGPLGYLIAPTFPEAEPWAVFTFAWGIALLTAYALWKLCRYARHWSE